MGAQRKTIDTLLEGALDRLENASKSRKKTKYTLADAIKHRHLGNARTKIIIDAFDFLSKAPLRNNDYFKYVEAYADQGKRLDRGYFKHNGDKLNDYYVKVDESKSNPFDMQKYREYVVYISLKLLGEYDPKTDDEIFNVSTKDNREFNPLTNIPSVLRGELHFKIKEYDIKKAFPTFIDIELGTNYRHTVYDIISKKKFSIALNSHNESKVSIEDARQTLQKVYLNRADEVLTTERFEQRGKAYRDLTKYESEYINKFVKANDLKDYVRLHDGVFVLLDVNVENTKFDKVEFAIKGCVKPKVENNKILFYKFNDKGDVVITPSGISAFLKQEKFVRITTGDDKIKLLKNNNNVIDYFCHKTNIVSFLESNIIEVYKDDVKDAIARHNNSTITQSYHLIEPTELCYYKDSKVSFGLPFKNGFSYFDNLDAFELKTMPYEDVKGFFSTHDTQSKTFTYTEEVGDFETFLYRASTGIKEYDSEAKEFQAISSIIGYLSTTYKKPNDNPIIVLTDEGANEETRNGRRGKSLLTLALGHVTKKLTKGNKEFVGGYLHNYAELDISHNLYVIDDAPAGFNYNDLYTSSTGSINVQPKGVKAFEIDFKDTPKFIVTSNYLFRLNKDDASSVARFVEFKFTPYYSNDHTPKMELKNLFFDEWDSTEWDRFYSFIYRCAFDYLKNGLKRMDYDKSQDNYNASIPDIDKQTMSEVLDGFYNKRQSFTSTNFYEGYKRSEFSSTDSLLNKKNTRKYVNLFIEANPKYQIYHYIQRTRTWEVKR